MAEPAVLPERRTPWHAWILLRCRAVQLRNAIDEQLRRTPLQTLAVLTMLGLIWFGLYTLLEQVLLHVRSWEAVGIIAQEHIFVSFFFMLALMLAFSNAILAFSSLYGRAEAAHLMSLPALARHVVAVKWMEGLFISSWSFLLLGVPLMLAVASQHDAQWHFYPLFAGHFLGFIIIPSTLGVLIAWAVARFAPRRPMTIALWCGLALLLVVIVWLWQSVRTSAETDEWLRRVMNDLRFTRSALLPSTWTAAGVIAIIDGRLGDSLFYLGIVAGNSAFLVWVTINLVGASWNESYSAAQQARGQTSIERGWATESLTAALFGYLPGRLYRIMLKDVRMFARDATQWTQMVIMLGLLLLYAFNLKRIPLGLEHPGTQAVVGFLNLLVVSLILATFTSRFVYPLLSLESQQLWLLGMLPVRRITLLVSKFLFALTVTGVAGLAVMLVAVTMLELPTLWAWLCLSTTVAICVGLCALSVGLGARFPVLDQRSPARIAAGLGGTLNLVASMAFVIIELVGIATLGVHELRGSQADQPGGPVIQHSIPATLSPGGWQLFACMMGLSLVVSFAALAAGGRHFARLEN